MLSDADRELITAAVDGELAPAQEPAFRQLLAHSPEATSLYKLLKGDSRQLQGLPRLLAPPTLAPAVCAALAGLPRVTVRRPEPRVGWMPYVVAASALVAVATAAFWFASREADEATRVVQKQNQAKLLPDPNRVSPAVPSDTGREEIAAPRLASTQPNASGFAHAEPKAEVPELAPEPRAPGGGSVVGSGPLDDLRPVETVRARLPFLAPVADLDRDDTKAAVLSELTEAQAFRLDLFTPDTVRGGEAVLAAARSVGLTVTVDAVAADRLAKKLPTAWVVYTDALTPQEITKLLGHLADKHSAAFGSLHLVPAGRTDQQALRELLGVDPGLWRRPDDAKGVSAGTADQVAAALLKDRPAKPALLAPYAVVGGKVTPASAKEARQYLGQRGARHPSALPVMIVIRPAS